MLKNMKDTLRGEEGLSLVELIVLLYMLAVVVLVVLAFMKIVSWIAPAVMIGIVVVFFIVGAIATRL